MLLAEGLLEGSSFKQESIRSLKYDEYWLGS